MEPHSKTGLIVVDEEVVSGGSNFDQSLVDTGFDYKKPITGKVLKALVEIFVPEGAVNPAQDQGPSHPGDALI